MISPIMEESLKLFNVQDLPIRKLRLIICSVSPHLMLLKLSNFLLRPSSTKKFWILTTSSIVLFRVKFFPQTPTGWEEVKLARTASLRKKQKLIKLNSILQQKKILESKRISPSKMVFRLTNQLLNNLANSTKYMRMKETKGGKLHIRGPSLLWKLLIDN